MIGCLKVESCVCLRFEAFSRSVIAEKHQTHVADLPQCAEAAADAFKKAVRVRTE